MLTHCLSLCCQRIFREASGASPSFPGQLLSLRKDADGQHDERCRSSCCFSSSPWRFLTHAGGGDGCDDVSGFFFNDTSGDNSIDELEHRGRQQYTEASSWSCIVRFWRQWWWRSFAEQVDRRARFTLAAQAQSRVEHGALQLPGHWR
jgi:hypothetical protein